MTEVLVDDKYCIDNNRAAEKAFKDRRRRQHPWVVTIAYRDGEQFQRVYTDERSARSFTARQERSPVVTATRLRLISGDLSLADAMCDIEMPHYKQNLSSHELEKLILYNVFLVEAIADLLIEKGILTRAEIKERVMRLKAEAPPQPRWLQ